MIHKLRTRGLRMVDARQRAIDRFDGRALGDGRTLSLSVPTIQRHFYLWAKAPERTHFLYCPPASEIDTEKLRKLVGLCIREGLTLGEGYRRETARGVRPPFC